MFSSINPKSFFLPQPHQTATQQQSTPDTGMLQQAFWECWYVVQGVADNQPIQSFWYEEVLNK